MSFISKKSTYVIPFVLFLNSFLIYSYNLEGQPWHGDEINYLGWAGNYINLVNKGDFSNSCLKSIDHCNLLYHIPAHGLTYSPLRMLLIGYPMDMRNQNSGDFYDWSCYYFKCYTSYNAPTVEQMTTGRLFSPLFGSLTIVISFLVGKILFNRYIGIIFSLLFLFYDLWIWYSRTIMTEVHYIFFAMLSLLLLLYSFKTGHLKVKYLVASAAIFGLALTSKILSVEFSILFLSIILFGSLLKIEEISNVAKRKIPKIGLSVFLFFSVTVFSFFLTQPGFYSNPLNQIAITKMDMDNYNRDVWYIGYPTVHNISFTSVVSLFHYVLFPSFIEKQIAEPNLNLSGNFGWTNPLTYSSVPMTIFFFIGFGYLIYRLVKFKSTSEAILLIWFTSTLIFTLLMARDLSLERYLLPFIISIIMISSYGLWNFIKEASHNKTKIIFAIYFIFAHSVTALSYWGKIYFSPGTIWANPLHYGTLQESLDNSFGFVVNAVFIGFLIFMMIILFQNRIKVSHSLRL